MNIFPQLLYLQYENRNCILKCKPHKSLLYRTSRLSNSAYADGGPRSRVCARETLRSAPHRRERKFFGARVCSVAGGGGKIFKSLVSDRSTFSKPAGWSTISKSAATTAVQGGYIAVQGCYMAVQGGYMAVQGCYTAISGGYMAVQGEYVAVKCTG